MSILIEGMEMPETCTDCFACHIVEDECYCEPLDTELKLGHCGRLSACPLVPVPPHGNLIDQAELWVEINKICDRRDAGIISDLTCLQQLLSVIRHAPTIIPAEEGE